MSKIKSLTAMFAKTAATIRKEKTDAADCIFDLILGLILGTIRSTLLL